MKLRFWGVRGSFATTGSEFVRYGGHTTAIEVRSDSGKRVLVDLGTGATEFAKSLMSTEFGKGKGHLPVLMTHTHIDHIQGLPFFTPFFVKGNSMRILGAGRNGTSLDQILQRQLNGHYSPLYALENLAAGVAVETLEPGSSWPVEGFEVSSCFVPHGGTQVLAYRITADGKSVVIMTDVEHGEDGISLEALELAKGCDLLVHDAMFTDAEYRLRAGWGHSPVSSALAVARASEAGRVALFHHSPDSRDVDIDEMVGQANASSEVEVFAAQEGHEIEI